MHKLNHINLFENFKFKISRIKNIKLYDLTENIKFNNIFLNNYNKYILFLSSLSNPFILLLSNIIGVSYYYKYLTKDYVNKLSYAICITIIEFLINEGMINLIINNIDKKTYEKNIKKIHKYLLCQFIIIIIAINLIFQYNNKKVFPNNFGFRLINSLILTSIFLFLLYSFDILYMIYVNITIRKFKLDKNEKEQLVRIVRKKIHSLKLIY